MAATNGCGVEVIISPYFAQSSSSFFFFVYFIYFFIHVPLTSVKWRRATVREWCKSDRFMVLASEEEEEETNVCSFLLTGWRPIAVATLAHHAIPFNSLRATLISGRQEGRATNKKWLQFYLWVLVCKRRLKSGSGSASASASSQNQRKKKLLLKKEIRDNTRCNCCQWLNAVVSVVQVWQLKLYFILFIYLFSIRVNVAYTKSWILSFLVNPAQRDDNKVGYCITICMSVAHLVAKVSTTFFYFHNITKCD